MTFNTHSIVLITGWCVLKYVSSISRKVNLYMMKGEKMYQSKQILNRGKIKKWPDHYQRLKDSA